MCKGVNITPHVLIYILTAQVGASIIFDKFTLSNHISLMCTTAHVCGGEPATSCLAVDFAATPLQGQ